jgi:coproporphyrinogen III oxidase-like Fe-S oxidoreductase
MVVSCRIGLLIAVFVLPPCTEVESFLSSPAFLIDKSAHRLVLGCHGGISNYIGENDVAARSSQEEQKPPIGLYVHIPYCRRRCRYCSFAVVPIGTNVETNAGVVDSDPLSLQSMGFHHMNQEYTAALLKELQQIQKNHGNTEEKVHLHSIYFGGGTPSLMPIESLRIVLAAIGDVFRIERGHCEITMEVDPGTFTMKKLQAWKDLGINRLSLGVQTFDDSLLESLGRIHRLKDIYDAVAMMRDVYGEDLNYSIDLISGLPGLSIALWTETLQIATAELFPRPKHLSVYDLQIEQVRLTL